MNDGSPHELSAAYALDALDGDDLRAYEEHLAGCERCREDVASFRATASALAYDVDLPPPAETLEHRILDAARAERPNVVPVPRRGRSQATVRELAHLSDEAVLALIARADEQALAELYRRFGRLAYGLALRILRDDALAQDAVQEAFLGVWRAADRFTAERAKPSTWLLTLVHRRTVDLVRREERRRTEPLPPEAEPAVADSDDEAELATRRQTIRAALRELPPEQREAIELAYYGGYTQSEVAERLGRPLGTIKSRMFTGLARLRETLGEENRAQLGPGA